MYRSRSLIVALAVVTLVTLLPDTALAAGRCVTAAASTPEERAALWSAAVERFSAARPDLNAEQTHFIREALRMGNDIATLNHDEQEQAAFIRKASRLMEQAEDLFSNNELGELFTPMGQTQIWFAQLAASVPHCNCIGSGECEMGPGGPKGKCVAGCKSWDGSDGWRRDGICSEVIATPTDPAEPTTN